MTSIGATEGMPTEARAPSARRIRSIGGGGGGTRSYVAITAVTDSANYIGDILNNPEDATIIKTGVNIKVIGATANAYTVGYKAFADSGTDDLGDTYYYIDGFLLS